MVPKKKWKYAAERKVNSLFDERLEIKKKKV